MDHINGSNGSNGSDASDGPADIGDMEDLDRPVAVGDTMPLDWDAPLDWDTIAEQTIPWKVAVFGSGGGALAVAADMARHGRETVMADFDDFRHNLEPVASRRGVVVHDDWHGPHLQALVVADSIAEALDEARLAVVVVPCFAHERWVEALAPHIGRAQVVLFLGEGSGAIVARRAIDPPTVVAEANTLPYLARLVAPGEVTAFRKHGGVLISSLPATGDETARVMGLIDDVWPYAQPTDTVWNTVLANYNAIDHVAAMVANAGTLENRTGGMLLWGEGATPSVVNVIEAVDAELMALRRALNSRDPRRYQDFLVAQGFAPDLGAGASLFDTVRASKLVVSYAPTGDAGGLNTRYVTEDVPYALVLASSLGTAVGVATPVIDGLVALSSAMLGRDFRAEGRTLATLGLDGLDATGLVGFARTGIFP